MYIGNPRFKILLGCQTILLLTTIAIAEERIINISGWNLPDPNKMVFRKIEKIVLPGIPIEVTTEERYVGPDSEYYIQNPPRSVGKAIDSRALINERVEALTIYKDPDGHVLCYWYVCGFGGPPRQRKGGMSAAFICDLDDDGCNETKISYLGEVKRHELLSSLLRVKLGLSEEAELVRKVIRSSVAQLRECSSIEMNTNR